MAWRLEVKTRSGWVVMDEERGTDGQKMPTRTQYETQMRNFYPILMHREYRITKFDSPKVQTLFTLRIY